MSLRDKETLLPQIAPFSTQSRALFQAQNAVRTKYFKARVSATVQVTVAGTLVRNDGSVLGLFTVAGIQQGSKDQIGCGLRLLRHLSEAFTSSPLKFG